MVYQKVDERLEKLIVRLRDNEQLSYKDIAEHVGIRRQSLPKIYKRAKDVNRPPANKGGRPRITDKRLIFLI